jgi:hypothetical protein
MAESILDRLDRDPGGARQYVATLTVIGGATRAQVADALARKYGINPPTGRSVTKWKSEDPELRALIEQMRAAKRDVAPGDDPADLIPVQVDPAEAVSDLFGVAIQFPHFARLVKVDAAEIAPDGGPELGGFAAGSGGFYPPADAADPADDAVRAVLDAEHETAAEFEADCRARLPAAA